MELSSYDKNSENGILKLDPRTKLFSLVLLSFMAFTEVPLYITVVFSLIPFFCLFLSNHKKIAIIYIIMFILAKLSQIYLVESTTGILNIFVVGFSYTFARMLPIGLMAVYFFITTKVSEIIASLEQIKMPRYVTIPISVIFRYVPTVFEDIKAIRDAMKMRGIGLNIDSLKAPHKLIEYLFIPILINAVKTSDELTAASLSRGLSNPNERTNICEINFGKSDIIVSAVVIIGFLLFILSKFGGITIV
ncbi:energy-coupling factor transporter transmembrane protein EcfT [Methanobrevibacter oralis]|uniref:Energy-coupling factor transporter transmembrane protein EcfT n=1 Tax=Methanobrevibacter oralis TaxID=66851 RepID=A0A166CA58_METOA|nr:energy-coupling factor transporter transmembrane component T [Methanobrevibacter oralis]KZX14289.1 energy-coupling factor transporter transmembrane protein EcfT [Methanobrevibacter oralis]